MTLLFVTPSDEPPLAANIGRHCMGKMLAETHMRRSIFVYLQRLSSHSLRQARRLHQRCTVRVSAMSASQLGALLRRSAL